MQESCTGTFQFYSFDFSRLSKRLKKEGMEVCEKGHGMPKNVRVFNPRHEVVFSRAWDSLFKKKSPMGLSDKVISRPLPLPLP